jgi:hypothetical protein
MGKYAEQIRNHSESAISMMFWGNAIDDLVAPTLSSRLRICGKLHKIENFFDSDFGICDFFVSYVKILRFYKRNFLIGPLLGEVRFFRGVLGLRRMKKIFEVGQNFFIYFLQLWTLNMTQY